MTQQPPVLTLPELPSIPAAGPITLEVPAELELPDLSKIGDDPDLMRFAVLETWRRILGYHWQTYTHELWQRDRRGDKERLTEMSGMSRAGIRRRGSQTYDQARKGERRRAPRTRTGDS